jgi:molybdopterin-guanine dinucleotide biosynthesis protein A
MGNQLREHIVGVVLAGGLSRRMFAERGGSGDKALLDLAGRSMIRHVIEKLAAQTHCVIVNANGDPGRFQSLGRPVVADTVEGFVGPLAGVLAGMRWAATHRPEAAYIATASADAPFLPDDLVVRLCRSADRHPGAIAMARSGGEIHPVIGLWPVALADDLEGALRSGVRKVLAWTDRHGTLPVDFEPVTIGGRTVDPFFNANTPADLDEARRLLASKPS